MTGVVVYGASGHGRVVADALRAVEANFVGFIDDGETPPTIGGYPVLGTGKWLRECGLARGLTVALGVGDNGARGRIAKECVSAGLELVTVVHPRATISPEARLGVGVVVMAGVVVNSGADVGDGAILNSGAIIEHDVVIGCFAHVSPNATLGGGAVLGSFTHLGLGAVVLPLVSVGEHTIVGAGAVVTRTLPARVVATGVPAKARRALRTP